MHCFLWYSPIEFLFEDLLHCSSFLAYKAHSESMAAIMQSMSSQKAWRVLEKNNLTTPALIEVTRDLRTTNLRKAKPEDPKKGYSGVDGARKLLNDMIEESMEKYDKEIATCTAYYSSQFAAMEGCRGADCGIQLHCSKPKSLILDAQSTIIDVRWTSRPGSWNSFSIMRSAKSN